MRTIPDIAALLDANDYLALIASAPRPMTVEWLRSRAYHAIMMRHITDLVARDEGSKMAPSYVFRHATAGPWLGAWKWRGMHRFAGIVLQTIENASIVLDFGGASGPLGCGSRIVDRAPIDLFGQPVAFASLDMLRDGLADVVFSSHTLEHIDDLDGTLAQVSRVLCKGGTLIAMVPSWRREGWRVGNLKSEEWGDHVWDFGLEMSAPVPLQRYTNIAVAIARHLAVDDAWWCGDDCIMVIARKP